MEAVKGYVENGVFYPMGKISKNGGRVKAVLTVLDEPLPGDFDPDKKTPEELEAIRRARQSLRGSMEIWMSECFDEPLEEMKEYM